MKPMSGCALIGAARALSGIRDGVVLQHSVVGCHWGSLAAGMLQQPDDFRQASTVVYEENVIQGGTELIPQGLDNIMQLYPDAKVIFVISGRRNIRSIRYCIFRRRVMRETKMTASNGRFWLCCL